MEDQDALFVVKSRFTLTEEALAAALARAEKAERRVAELEQDAIAELEAAQDWRPAPSRSRRLAGTALTRPYLPAAW